MPRKNQRRGAPKRKIEEVDTEPQENMTPLERDISQVTRMIGDAVDRGYELEGPESMLNMLKSIAPKVLCEFKEDRHRFQTAVVQMLDDCILSIKTRMDAKMAEMNTKQGSADEVKAGLEKIRDEADAELTAKSEAFNAAKNLMKEKIDEHKVKTKVKDQLDKDLIAKQDALKELEERKKDLEEVYNIHFTFLIAEPTPEPVAPEPVVEAPPAEPVAEMAEAPAEAPAPEAAVEEAAPAPEAPPAEEKIEEPEKPKLNRKKSTKIVLDKFAELEMELSCLDTLKSVLKKIPSEYSGFDSSTSKYSETWCRQQIHAFTSNMLEEQGRIASTSTEISAAGAACTLAGDERCHSTEDMESSKVTKSEGAEKLKIAQKAIRAHIQEHKEIHDQKVKHTKWLEEFQFCILAFRHLADRTKPPPAPEPVAAPEPDVLMAEVPTEA